MSHPPTRVAPNPTPDDEPALPKAARPRVARAQSAGSLRPGSAAATTSTNGLLPQYRRLHRNVLSAAGAELHSELTRRASEPSTEEAACAANELPAEPVGEMAELSVDQVARPDQAAHRGRGAVGSPHRRSPCQSRPSSASSLNVALLGSRSAGWVGTIDWHDVGAAGVPGRPASACTMRSGTTPLVQTAVAEGVSISRPAQVVPRHMRALPYEWMGSLRTSSPTPGLHAGLIGAAHKRGEWITPTPDKEAEQRRKPVPPWLGRFRMGSLQHDRRMTMR